MVARKAYSRISCSTCGETLSEHKLWVDDGGFLCRSCAILSRYRRMRGEHLRPGRKPFSVGLKER